MLLRPGRLVLLICLFLALPLPAHCQPAVGKGKEVPAKEKFIRTDLYGDPFPEKAIARLGSARFQHPSPNNLIDVAFSRNGKTLLGVGELFLCFWETATGKELARMKAPINFRAAAFTPDGNGIALAYGSVVEIFDWRSSKSLRTFTNPKAGMGGIPKAPGFGFGGFGGDGFGGGGFGGGGFGGGDGFGAGPKVCSLAFSPDGTTLAGGWASTVSSEKFGGSALGLSTIHLWDVSTGRVLMTFKGLKTSCDSLTFSADGKRLIAGPVIPVRVVEFAPGLGLGAPVWVPEGVCVLDLASRKKRSDLATPDFSQVGYAPNGRAIAVVTEDGALEVVDVGTAKKHSPIKSGVKSFTFGPDGRLLATLEDRPRLCLRDAVSGKEVRHFQGYQGACVRLGSFSHDGQLLAVICGFPGGFGPGGFGPQPKYQNSWVSIWDVQTGKEVRRESGHQDEVTCVAFAPGGGLLASASRDHTVRLWDPATGKELRLLEGRRGAVTAVTFSPNGKVLASSSAEGATHLWDPATAKELSRFEGPKGGATALTFTPDGKALTALGSTGTVHRYLVADSKRSWKFEIGQGSFPTALAPGGGVVLVATDDEQDAPSTARLRLWNSTTGKPTRNIVLRQEVEESLMVSRVVALTLSPDGRLFASGHYKYSPIRIVINRSSLPEPAPTHQLRLWERVTGQEMLEMNLGTAAIQSLTFSPDCRLLAAGLGTHPNNSPGAENCVVLRDTLTGEKLAELPGHAAEVSCLAFSLDGTRLASGSADHTIVIWENVRPATKPAAAATAKQLQGWWAALSGDAAGAHKALARLVARPAQAVPLLAGHLKPAPAVDAQRIAELIKELNSPRFGLRQQASIALEKFGEGAEPALRQALMTALSLENRRRLEQLLDKLDSVPEPVSLRGLRAVTALEWIANPDAQRVLAALAKGGPEARLTQEARSALERLKRK